MRASVYVRGGPQLRVNLSQFGQHLCLPVNSKQESIATYRVADQARHNSTLNRTNFLKIRS